MPEDEENLGANHDSSDQPEVEAGAERKKAQRPEPPARKNLGTNNESKSLGGNARSSAPPVQVGWGVKQRGNSEGCSLSRHLPQREGPRSQ